MNPQHFESSNPAPHARRRVRIVERKPVHRTATFSLLVATAVALALILIFRMWRTEDPPQAFQRSLPDVQMEWRCMGVGHVFRLSGQVEPRVCPLCQALSYPVAPYHCPVHRDVHVWARFSFGEGRDAHLSHFKVGDGDWVPAEQQLKCPKCGRPLLRKREDPLKAKGRNRKRGG